MCKSNIMLLTCQPVPEWQQYKQLTTCLWQGRDLSWHKHNCVLGSHILVIFAVIWGILLVHNTVDRWHWIPSQDFQEIMVHFLCSDSWYVLCPHNYSTMAVVQAPITVLTSRAENDEFWIFPGNFSATNVQKSELSGSKSELFSKLKFNVVVCVL